MNKREPYPSLNQIQPFVQTELNDRKSRPSVSANESNSDSKSQQIRVPFTRMTSMVASPKIGTIPAFNFLTLGFHGYGENVDVFSLTTSGRNIVGYGYVNGQKTLIDSNQASKELAIHGFFSAPGIIGVDVNRRQAGAPTKVTVRWKCYNVTQLEYLKEFFMTPGVYVVVEWGQKTTGNKPFKTLDFSDTGKIVTELTNYVARGKEFSGAYEKYIEPSHGNYDFIIGITANFQLEMDGANGFNCTTELYTIGEALYGMTNSATITSQSEINLRKTIKEYFNDDGAASNDVGLILAERKQGVTVENKFFNKLAKDATDQDYISWGYFIETMVPNMLKGLISSAITSKSLRIPTLDDEPFVGSHRFLRSSDPTVMIIGASTAPTTFQQFTIPFDNPNQKGSGKLSQGVWVNYAMIKQSFLEVDTFVEAFKQILDKMNKASENYWNLKLIFDEEKSIFNIIDLNHDHLRVTSDFYTFNKGSRGELLKLTFEGSLSNEMKTQIYLSSYNQVQGKSDERISTPQNRLSLLHQLELEKRDLIREAIDANKEKFDNANPTALTSRNESAESKIITKFTSHGNNSRMRTDGLGPSSSDGQSVGNGVISPEWADPIPTRNRISSRFGDRPRPKPGASKNHRGVDISAPTGTGVYAASGGKISIHHDNGDANGNQVKIIHEGGYLSVYDHLSSFNPAISSGQLVRKGDLIGFVGNTGVSTGPHLHFAIYYNGKFQDPESILGKDLRGSSVDDVKTTTKLASAPAGELPINSKLKSDGTFEKEEFLRYNGYNALPVRNTYTATPEQIKNLETRKKIVDLTDKFGDGIIEYIAVNPSDMRESIIRDSVEGTPNNFVAPMMTEYQVELELSGISGLFPGDGFYIEKIPRMYKDNGVFQIHGLQESISVSGWNTRIMARYKITKNRKVIGL